MPQGEPHLPPLEPAVHGDLRSRRLRAYSIVEHVGRRSGRAYANPVSAYRLGDGFGITILYGVDAQWVRHVLATGQLTLRTRGRDHVLVRPELISAPDALPAYPWWQQRTLRTRGVEHFLWAHQPGPSPQSNATVNDGSESLAPVLEDFANSRARPMGSATPFTFDRLADMARATSSHAVGCPGDDIAWLIVSPSSRPAPPARGRAGRIHGQAAAAAPTVEYS